MTKLIETKVSESLPQLKSILKEVKPYLKPRIRMLLALKKERRATRINTAKSAGASYSSILKWSELYEKGGLKALMQLQDKGHRRFLWPEKVHQDLAARLQSGEPTSYKELHKWLQKKHGLKVSLPTLYKYARKDFGEEIRELRLNQLPEIKESLAELKEAYKLALPRIKPRIQILIMVKERKINGIGDITRETGSSFMRIMNCLELYTKGGLTAVRQSQAGPFRTVITEETHNAIKKRLQSKPNEKLSDLHRWLQKNHAPKLQYVTLHSHLRKHFPGKSRAGKSKKRFY